MYETDELGENICACFDKYIVAKAKAKAIKARANE
jgi:hypothetical protein